MNERVVVDMVTLRRVVTALLSHLADQGGSEIALRHDMFWSVDMPEIFDLYSRPENLTIGQLSESWESLRRMVDEDRVLAYGLVWLADVLRAVGLEHGE